MLSKIVQFFKHYRAAILTGFLIGTSYIPFPPWASLFCFIPLWWFWSKNLNGSWKPIFISGWIAGFLLTLIGFNWIAFTIHEFGRMPWPNAIIGLLGFCSISNLDLALSGLSLWFLGKKLKLGDRHLFLLFPVITALYETYVPSIFPWNYGYSFYWVKLPIFQLAEIIGFQGISTLVIFINAVIFIGIVQRKSIKRNVVLASAAFVILNIFGFLLAKTLPKPDQEAKIAIVQANIGNLEKQYAELGLGFRDSILQRYSKLSADAVRDHGPLDFVVWPETAFPSTIFDTGYGDDLVAQMKDTIRSTNTPFVIGGYGHHNESGKPKNAIFIFNPDGQYTGKHYFKTHLLAFGEYIPGVEIFPKLRQWIPAGEFARGQGPQVIEFNRFKLGLQICYESLFPDYTLALGDGGANLLINVTNDSWYGTWQEPYQHMMMTLGRAVEIRRPLIRSTNTGISTVVLADGQILQKSPMNQEWYGAYTVPYLENPKPTIYQRFPWLIDMILILSLLLIIGRSSLGRIKRS